MSQPTLNSSFSGINFVGMNKGRFSYSSLRASGDNSINFQIEEERLSAPNVQLSGSSDHKSRHSQPDVTRFLRHDIPSRRERLSQPTLVTGDYYPGRVQQRLSQPCLSTGKELPVIHSPLKPKRFVSPVAVKATQRDRLSQLDFGARYRNLRDFPSTVTKFNRDRFSIPELETSNDLRLMAGTPKQRFSLDSSLNEPGRSRLLPIASSPISETHPKTDPPDSSGSKAKKPAEGLESVLITSTSPILSKPGTVFPPPVVKVAPPRERLSVPEIRNSSLRRLLDSPVKQRHSITGNLRQCLLPITKNQETTRTKISPKALIEEINEKISWKDSPKQTAVIELPVKEEPKHIQRHYSYTYDTKEENSLLSKLSVAPKKKYLESNFDKNEQVITTVIETEIPMILSSPKYTKKTHAYSSEAPRWMRKYLENESPQVARKNVNKEKSNIKNNWINSNRESLDSIGSEKTQSEKTLTEKTQSRSNDNGENSPLLRSTDIQADPKDNMKNTYVRIRTSNDGQEDKYKVSIDSSWTEADICRLYGLECDTDTDESTSI
ncbi:uncharacterized protein LOC107273311 [Cephus cinctus]|uniref:Uncharacterized protein LOC107273311 n=1 Tax=Cephus cinctus TaxID=211228 RepID=A0AAJ7FT29_CEPCN|nr:uncharacterized protein LOC107273311 [Cephus cinctus]